MQRSPSRTARRVAQHLALRVARDAVAALQHRRRVERAQRALQARQHAPAQAFRRCSEGKGEPAPRAGPPEPDTSAGARLDAPGAAPSRPTACAAYSSRRRISRETQRAHSATRPSSSARDGLASSAAAVGVGARWSAAKSAMVKSVSWPTPTTTGIGQARMARATASSLNCPEVLDRAAAAHQQQHVALGARAGAREHRRDALGRARALHRDRIDDHRDRRVAPRERGQHVAQRRRGGRSEHADGARDAAAASRLAAASNRPSRSSLSLSRRKRSNSGPTPAAAHRLDGELEAAARLVERDQRARLDLHAFARLPVQSARRGCGTSRSRPARRRP